MPAVTGLGVAVFVIVNATDRCTVVVTAAVWATLTSVAVTPAVLVMTCPCAALALTVPVMVSVTLLLAARLLSVQVIVALPEQLIPPVVTEKILVTESGGVSVSTTLVAALGPVLVMRTV